MSGLFAACAADPPARKVEPRPKIRPAREVLQELAAERLWDPTALRDDAPKGEIAKLYPKGGRVALDTVTVVTTTAGALFERTYDVALKAWWDDWPAAVDQIPKLERATSLLGVDLHEVPPPYHDAEYGRQGKRALRFHGAVRVAALGFEARALLGGSEQATLDEARRRLAEADEHLGSVIAGAVASLPAVCVVERLLVTPERVELWIAGPNEPEARALAARFAAAGGIDDRYGDASLGRRADTFIISVERKR